MTVFYFFLFFTHINLCYPFIRKRKFFKHNFRKRSANSCNSITNLHTSTLSVNAERQTDPFTELRSSFDVIRGPLLICKSCSARIWDLTNG